MNHEQFSNMNRCNSERRRGFVQNGSKAQTLDQMCMYDILVPNIRYKQQIEKEAYLEEHGLQGRL